MTQNFMIDFWILLAKLDILKKFLRQFYEGLRDKKVENDATDRCNRYLFRTLMLSKKH